MNVGVSISRDIANSLNGDRNGMIWVGWKQVNVEKFHFN
jgi:hypothetical protein